MSPKYSDPNFYYYLSLPETYINSLGKLLLVDEVYCIQCKLKPNTPFSYNRLYYFMCDDCITGFKLIPPSMQDLDILRESFQGLVGLEIKRAKYLYAKKASSSYFNNNKKDYLDFYYPVPNFNVYVSFNKFTFCITKADRKDKALNNRKKLRSILLNEQGNIL